jgi:hypothetical protein
MVRRAWHLPTGEIYGIATSVVEENDGRFRIIVNASSIVADFGPNDARRFAEWLLAVDQGER